MVVGSALAAMSALSPGNWRERIQWRCLGRTGWTGAGQPRQHRGMPAPITKLSDRFADYTLRIRCKKCGHERATEPHALAKLLGWETPLTTVATRLRCSRKAKPRRDRPRRGLRGYSATDGPARSRKSPLATGRSLICTHPHPLDHQESKKSGALTDVSTAALRQERTEVLHHCTRRIRFVPCNLAAWWRCHACWKAILSATPDSRSIDVHRVSPNDVWR